jgi:ribose transport system substrate-binding protein
VRGEMKQVVRVTLAFVSVLASLPFVALLAAGCKQPAPPAPAAPPATPAVAAPASKPIKIAMIAKSSTNPVFLSARRGAETAARDLTAKVGAPIEIVWLTPPEEDGQIQAQRIAQAVNEGASAILISCSDAGKVTGAIDDAVARGVPVMTFDSDAPKSKRFAYYGVDDRRIGEEVMEELSKMLDGKGKVAILAGNQNAPNLRHRVDGIKAEAAKSKGIQIVGTFYHNETPQDAAAEVIRVNNAYPGIRGWAMAGGWALFTKTLLTDLDPAKIKLVAVDGLPPELPYVEKGLAPVLLAQSSYLWGNVGVTKIIDKIVFKKDVPEIIPMDPVRVSRDNLGSWARQLRQWGFPDLPEEYLKLK